MSVQFLNKDKIKIIAFFLLSYHLMKPSSLLNTVPQPHPHRTSLHLHMQSTAYHYNSLLNAKSEIDNTPPNKKTCLNSLKNKRTKNMNAERIAENKKLLKSLIDIQRNYTLYGVKNQNESITNYSGNLSQLTKKKRRSFESKVSPIQNVKTLKNPFIQKMKTLRISEQNLKLFEKVSNAQSSVANKKQMKLWNTKIRYFGNIIQTSLEKQSSESFKNHFFSTYMKLRESRDLEGLKIKLEKSLLIPNPQLRTLNAPKRLFDQVDIKQLKQKIRIKHKKKKNGSLKKMQTEITENRRNERLYTQNSVQNSQRIE